MSEKKIKTKEDYFRQIVGRSPTPEENKEYVSNPELKQDMKFVQWVNDITLANANKNKQNGGEKTVSKVTDKYAEKLEAEKATKEKNKQILGQQGIETQKERQQRLDDEQKNLIETMQRNRQAELASASPKFKEEYAKAQRIADGIQQIRVHGTITGNMQLPRLLNEEAIIAEKILNPNDKSMRFQDNKMTFVKRKVIIYESVRNPEITLQYEKGKWFFKGSELRAEQIELDAEGNPVAIVYKKGLLCLFSKPKSAMAEIPIELREEKVAEPAPTKIQAPVVKYRCPVGCHKWQECPDQKTRCILCGVEFYSAEENVRKKQ